MKNKKSHIFLDIYGNLELYLAGGENPTYQIKHKEGEEYCDLEFVSNEGFLTDEYYPLTPLEWLAVTDWKKEYL